MLYRLIMEIIVKNFNLEKQLNKINASPDHGFIFYDDDEKPEDLSKKYVIRKPQNDKIDDKNKQPDK